jgi:hypothetical protein
VDLVRYREVRIADLLDDQKTAAEILGAYAASETQEDLQEYVLSQLKRIVFGDSPGEWNADFVAAGIKSLADLAGGGGSSVIAYPNFAAFPDPTTVPLQFGWDQAALRLYLSAGGVWRLISGGANSEIVGEEPGGAKDNVNVLFTTATPFVASTTKLYVNGVRQLRSATADYVEGGDHQSVVLAHAPAPTDNIQIDYIPA